MNLPAFAMNNGRSIPQIGLGASPMKGEQVSSIVARAIEIGYRHIDTALR